LFFLLNLSYIYIIAHGSDTFGHFAESFSDFSEKSHSK
jgi:hypothetical protein